MCASSGAGGLSPCSTVRACVLAIALISRIECLYLASQWPRYFPTYHSSSALLHLDVPPVRDGASWRRTADIHGPQKLMSRPANLSGSPRSPGRSGQDVLRNTNDAPDTGAGSHGTRGPSTLRAFRLRKGVALVPVGIPVHEEAMQTLASAPLHDKHVQTFLVAADERRLGSQTIPLTARRPTHTLGPRKGTHEVPKASCDAEAATRLRRSHARAAPQQIRNTDRWLWRLLMPFLSWDSEYFVTCAMQHTRYFFEMTHAFFPGLGMTFVGLKELFRLPSRTTALLSSSANSDSSFVEEKPFFSSASFLSDATCFALIGITLSNVSFMLATLGVFEVAFLLLSSRCAGVPGAATPDKPTAADEVHGQVHPTPRDEPASTIREKVTGVARQRQVPSPRNTRAHMVSHSQPLEQPLRTRGAGRYRALASTGTPTQNLGASCFVSHGSLTQPKTVACWTAFWYAFSGANIHMSAAYTESFFACLSIWGLLLLLRAEERIDNAAGTSSSWKRSAEGGRGAGQTKPSRTDPPEHYAAFGVSRATTRGDLPQLNSLTPRNPLPTCGIRTLRTKGREATNLARRYCFSWASTALFTFAALLRSNGSLSLIPLFFHTLRTCPGVSRLAAARWGSSSSERQDRDSVRVLTLASASSVYKFCLSVDAVKLAGSVLAHWVNALLQAIVVLLAPFLVCAYPYYLYCACPQTLDFRHLHASAMPENRVDEELFCQSVSRFLGQYAKTYSTPVFRAAPTSPEKGAAPPFTTCGGALVCGSLPMQPVPSPPSFISFTHSFFSVGLPYSLAVLHSRTSLPAVGAGSRSTRNRYMPPQGRPNEGYDGQRSPAGESSPWDYTADFLQSSGSNCYSADARPSWCANRFPNAYSSVQREYWGVGFFGFLRVETLYLIILCLPFYAVSVVCVRCLLAPRLNRLESIRANSQRARPPSRQWYACHNAGGQSQMRGTLVSIHARPYTQALLVLLSQETGHVVQLAVLSIVMLFFAHSNVFVRLSTACPIYFLYMALLHQAYSEALTTANEQRTSIGRVSASLEEDCFRGHNGCGGSGTRGLLKTFPISAASSESRDCPCDRRPPLVSGNWWEWCTAFVLLHHFLGPLLFSCYITWT